MKPAIQFSLGMLLAITSSKTFAMAQSLECLVGVPFTATRTFQTGGTNRLQKIGRPSNGSTFIEDFDAQGVPRSLTIKNVIAKQTLLLLLQTKQYAEYPSGGSDYQTYTPREWKDLSRIIQQQAGMQGRVALGSREEDGRLLFGSSSDFQGQTTETWKDADLGSTFRYTTHSPTGVSVRFSLDRIRREEPSQSIFEVPTDFEPAVVR